MSVHGFESWRRVIGHPDYEVSDRGRVRSYKAWRGMPTPRLMAQTLGTGGYPVVNMDGFPAWGVHKLVLEAFAGPRPHGAVARHLDGDRANNNLWNLAWGTPAENEADKVRHGTSNRGERHGMAKLTGVQAQEIREAAGTNAAIAIQFGISRTQVSVIRSGKAWVA